MCEAVTIVILREVCPWPANLSVTLSQIPNRIRDVCTSSCGNVTLSGLIDFKANLAYVEAIRFDRIMRFMFPA